MPETLDQLVTRTLGEKDWKILTLVTQLADARESLRLAQDEIKRLTEELKKAHAQCFELELRKDFPLPKRAKKRA